MVRAGLGPQWNCLFANDFDAKKAKSYTTNWGGDELRVADVRNIEAKDLPGYADLIWASFPCQDLSVAGAGSGLNGTRSGTFWPFIRLCEALIEQGRPPKIIALENVVGTLSSHGGLDFLEIVRSLVELGYKIGVAVIDAALFVPQSRPRLFVVAMRNENPPKQVFEDIKSIWSSPVLQNALCGLPEDLRKHVFVLDMPVPKPRKTNFIDVLEEDPASVKWHPPSETAGLLSLMSAKNLEKVNSAIASGVKTAGGLYKRTRWENGVKKQRAEVRFDNLAGCLRTPSGGSSRQTVLVVEGSEVRSRLLSSRESARLMGLPDDYILPSKYNEAYHLTGDGVVVPVVRHLEETIFRPLIAGSRGNMKAA